MKISKLHIKLVLIPAIILFCFQSVFADYSANFTRESIKKNRLVINNRLHSSQSLSKIYWQAIFETDKENGLNAITEPANKKYKRKNPIIAFGVAFVPGFFIHGLGHLYVEKYKTFIILLSIEAISTGLYFYRSFRYYNEIEKNDNEIIIFLLLITIWLGSWVYDIIGAAKIAYESSIYQKYSITTKSFLIDNELSKYAVISFNF